MTRREFLKALGITAASAFLPIGSLDAYPNFNPSCQYGDYIVDLDNVTPLILQEYQQMFYEQIRLCIPPEYRKDITWIVQKHEFPSEWLGRTTVAWKYTPKEEK